MADKQATVYIIDQGASMGEVSNGREVSNLDFALRYVYDKITTTLSAGRKTWTVGVIGLRTESTDNPLGSEEGYENISIMQPLGPMVMSDLRKLQEGIKVSGTENGDAISAIVVAQNMIEVFTKKLKYYRKIVLVTDGRGLMDGDDIDAIAEKLNEDDIELVVV
jgi:ATP-dependent DNA helicase 2 subunit 2